eukprot:3986549-Lingulodinium_polyedra.AAC.1
MQSRTQSTSHHSIPACDIALNLQFKQRRVRELLDLMQHSMMSAFVDGRFALSLVSTRAEGGGQCVVAR